MSNNVFATAVPPVASVKGAVGEVSDNELCMLPSVCPTKCVPKLTVTLPTSGMLLTVYEGLT
jgi:hypothetical protein